MCQQTGNTEEMDDTEEIDKYLDTSNLSRLNHEETGHINRFFE
jgi:hypothetical protein